MFFFLFFQLLWELKGFVICDLWFVGIKGFCVFFFAVNLVAMIFFCCEPGCCEFFFAVNLVAVINLCS